MIRFSLETEDADICVTHKGATPITWPEVMSLFADLLNGVSYIIDKDILEKHLEEAAEEMREAVFSKVNTAADNEKVYGEYSEAPF